MKIGGWLTAAVFHRYDIVYIVSEDEITDTLGKMEAARHEPESRYGHVSEQRQTQQQNTTATN